MRHLGVHWLNCGYSGYSVSFVGTMCHFRVQYAIWGYNVSFGGAMRDLDYNV